MDYLDSEQQFKLCELLKKTQHIMLNKSQDTDYTEEYRRKFLAEVGILAQALQIIENL